ncbi:molybdopterin-dependent oxidoreductase, partial [Klebsiella pneumoniae]|uniref:molybdopterin-dependent oxidoreductase n=1 Tax=Klebsiella pneumoniae TaxID=573 RepID=UPI00214C4E11
ILGAGVNHWYHMDMNYRGMINLLVFCGCVGQSGGGWSHYVGQFFVAPLAGVVVEIRGTVHLPRRTTPVQGERQRQPAGLRAQ